MNFANLWLVVFLIIALVFLIILLIIKYLLLRKKKGSTLFGDTTPHYFKGVLKRLNPFLIIKKKGKESKLGNSEDFEDSEEKLIAFQEPVPKKNKQITNKPNQQPENLLEKQPTNRPPRPQKKGLPVKAPKQPQDTGPFLKKKRKQMEEEISKETPRKAKPTQEKRVLIKVKDLGSLSKKLKNKEMAGILEHLKKEDYSLVEKLFLGKTFDSEKEFMDYLLEEIVRFLESKVVLLKDRISHLRKQGIEVGDIDYKLMVIPFKIKIFSASSDSKDFNKTMQMIQKIDEDIKKIETIQGSKEKNLKEKEKNLKKN